MDFSIFPAKEIKPTTETLRSVLGEKYGLWQNIRDYVFSQFPRAIEEWSFPGKKYGWTFRIKDTKRAIIYLLPKDGFFMVAFVFGQKATDQIISSDIHEDIKKDLKSAKPYAEGRGIRIEIKDEFFLEDIKKLIDIKIAY